MHPFDDLFGAKHVLHKPALGSSFGLRNIQKKRFIFCDDINLVEYAHEKTVPVATSLSLFIGKHTEVQAPQSFNDGNPDVKWNHGVIFTAKKDGLWNETSRISAEDIRHMRNRVEEFEFTSTIPCVLKDVESCEVCMAKWICEKASAWDASMEVASVTAGVSTPIVDVVAGFEDLMQRALVPAAIASEMLKDLGALGAVDVKELCVEDWETLPSWSTLRILQQRRLLSIIKSFWSVIRYYVRKGTFYI